jgi:hypothetical protein
VAGSRSPEGESAFKETGPSLDGPTYARAETSLAGFVTSAGLESNSEHGCGQLDYALAITHSGFDSLLDQPLPQTDELRDNKPRRGQRRWWTILIILEKSSSLRTEDPRIAPSESELK